MHSATQYDLRLRRNVGTCVIDRFQVVPTFVERRVAAANLTLAIQVRVIRSVFNILSRINTDLEHILCCLGATACIAIWFFRQTCGSE